MTHELCLLHANCQGEPLAKRLALSPEFAGRYTVRLITNYTRDPVPDADLARCSLFLHQHLGEEWGQLASDRLRARLPDSARALCIPNMFFKGYWPLWSGEPGFDYRDIWLDDLVDRDMEPEAVLALVLRTDPARWYNLDEILEQSLLREREREDHTPIKYLNYVIANWKRRRLFETVNHPRAELLDLVTRGILKHLDMEPPDIKALFRMEEPFPEFELPIHPAIAKRYWLAFGGPDEQYNIYGKPMSYARYAAAYVECRRAQLSDFIGFLRVQA